MGVHRYWRVYVTATTGSNMLLSPYEAEMRATVGGADQCNGGTASASHANSNVYKLFDNNFSSYWNNGSPGVDTWFQYDFGAGNEVDVGELAILARYASQMPKDFALQYSDNGTDWTEAHAWTGITDYVGGVWKELEIPQPPPIVAQWELPFDLPPPLGNQWDLPFALRTVVVADWDLPFGDKPPGYRYWRIYITDSSSASNLVSLYEAEMRATVGGADQCTGGTATASHADGDAYKLFDDNSGTYWINGSPGEDTWFQYDFGSGNAVEVAEIAMVPRYGSSQTPTDFSLQYSDNGTDYTTAATWTGVTDWQGGVIKELEVPGPPILDVQWDLPFALLTPVKADWELSYGVPATRWQWSIPFSLLLDRQWTEPFRNPTAQQFGMVFDLLSDARQWSLGYSLRVERQWETPWKRSLTQSWELPIYFTVDQAWEAPFALRSTLRRQWGSPYTSSNTVSRQWSLPGDILALNPVVLAWRMYWDLVPSVTVIDAATDVVLLHRGNPVRLLSANIGLSEGEYAWTGRMEIADPVAFQPMAVNDSVSLTLGGETYDLIIDNRTISRDGGERPRMVISVISSTASLATPRVDPMERIWDSPIMARDAAEQAVDRSIAWEILNWQLPGGRLAVFNAAPLEVVRTIARAAGGIVETISDGSLRVRHRFPISVPEWETDTPDHILTDVAHNLSISESHRFRTRINRVTIRELQPTSGYLSAQIDGRKRGGLNRGRTTFVSGQTPHFLVHHGSGVTVSNLDTTSGDLYPDAPQVFQMEEELFFSGTNQARLSRPARSLDSWIWLGADLGTLTLGPDGMTLTAASSGLAIARVTYTVEALAWGLSSPLHLGGGREFPIAVRIQGTESDVAGEQEATFQRGDGQFPGPDITEPLLAGFLAKQSRGRAEIDAGEGLQEITLTCVFQPGVMPGQLAEIHDEMMGQSWRGKIVSANHTVQGPVVTTELSLLRHVPVS